MAPDDTIGNVEAAPFRCPVRVRFVDTDASGRIHYTAMLRYFEAAEAEFMRHAGASYGHIGNERVAYPRVHVECDYLGALTHEDLIEIEVWVARLGERSFTLAFDATRDGRQVARGNIVVSAMDRQTQRSCALPTELAGPLAHHLRTQEVPHARMDHALSRR